MFYFFATIFGECVSPFVCVCLCSVCAFVLVANDNLIDERYLTALMRFAELCVGNMRTERRTENGIKFLLTICKHKI